MINKLYKAFLFANNSPDNNLSLYVELGNEHYWKLGVVTKKSNQKLFYTDLGVYELPTGNPLKTINLPLNELGKLLITRKMIRQISIEAETVQEDPLTAVGIEGLIKNDTDLLPNSTDAQDVTLLMFKFQYLCNTLFETYIE